MKTAMKPHNLIRPVGLAALALAMTAMSSLGDTVLLTDGFSGSDDDSLDSRVPDGENLPGRTWQQNGGYFGRSDIQGNTMNVRCMDGEAYDISSNESYTKPSVMVVQVDLKPGSLNRMGVGVGFTATPNTYNSTVYYVGLSLDQNGTIREWQGVPADPQDAIGQVAWSGIDNAAFSPGDWHTLTYTVNTATGMISDVSLSGSNADYSSLCSIVNAGLTDTNTHYITVMGDAQSGNGNGNIDNLVLTAPPAIILSASPAAFYENAGEEASTGTVVIPAALETDLVIDLASNDTSEVTVPASVTIPAGYTSATFLMDAVDDAEADGPKSVAITAAAEGYYTGQVVLTVEDDDVAIPPVPVGTVAMRGNSQVGLAWTASSGATGYNIKRSVTSGSGYTTIETVTSTTFTDSSAVNGTTYYYVITALNIAGESNASVEISATPTEGIGPPPGEGTVIIADAFGGSNDSSLDGRTPDDTNLPGRTWQQNGGYFGRSDIQSDTMNVRSMDGQAYDISSNEGYAKPTVMTVRVDLKPGSLNRMGLGVGFTEGINTWNSTYTFSGLSVDQDGTVKQWNGVAGDPQSAIRQVAWSGAGGAAFSPNDWHTLTYTINTFTGRISDVSLSGSNANYAPLCAIYNDGLIEARVNYLTVMGDAQSGNGNGNIDNLMLFAPSITQSADPFADWIAGFDFSAFTDPDLTPEGNPAGDGISNLVKFSYCLDPTVAANFANGLTRETWENFSGATVADLTGNRRFHLGPDDRDLVAGVNDNCMVENRASRYRGFLTAPVTGTYQFWISSQYEAELWLADGTIRKAVNAQTVGLTNRYGKQRIAFIHDPNNTVGSQEFDKQSSQRSRPVRLVAGQKYYFEVLQKQGQWPGHVSVAWQKPGSPREIIPAAAFNGDFTQADDLDDDALPSAWEIANSPLDPTDNGLYNPNDGQHGDIDLDGITNLEEYQLGSDPNHDDSANNISAVATPLDPQAYASATGYWVRDDSGSLTAEQRRGEISYTFTVGSGAAGAYEIVLTGGAAGVVRPTENLPLVFSINGSRVGSASLTSLDGGTDTATVITPWLVAGTHTLTILNDNYRADLRLRIDSLTVRSLGGSDVNGNGRPDWLELRLAADNRLTRVAATSLTSPLCIEGMAGPGVDDPNTTAGPVPGLSLSADNVALVPVPSVDSSFYADVPLSESSTVTLSASFQSGALTETREIAWVATNLFEHETLHIRKGDSLRLDAWTGQSPSGTFTVTANDTLLADGQANTTHTSGEPFTATFDTAGSYTLVATCDGTTTHTVTLNVHSANFGPALGVRAYYPRNWTPENVSAALAVEPDSCLAWQETTAEASPRSFQVTAFEAGQRQILARIPADAVGAPSAIVARGSINGFYLAYIDETFDAQVIHVFPDGTRLMKGSLVAVGLPQDIAICVHSIFQGTVFINGSDSLWLTAADFDQNGIATIYFEQAGNVSSGMCTQVSLYAIIPSAQN